MYMNNNKRADVRRSNDEFLRRMLGGDLVAENVLPMMNTTPTPPMKPSCQGDEGSSCPIGKCPKTIKAPALAMVYSPMQCWQNIFEPEEALKNGTMFKDLFLPFYGSNYKNGQGGRCK